MGETTLPNRIEKRFWSRIDKGTSDSACWIWTGTKDKGYGILWCGSELRTRRAYRIAYELVVGPIPDGLEIDHLCRVRACVNPAHLEPVTPAENNRRTAGHRPVPSHCPSGHAYDETNTARRHGRRYCRACDRARHRETYWAARAS